MMSRYLLQTALCLSSLAVPAMAQDAARFLVTTTADDGAGSLRSALAAASNANAGARIVVTVEGDIRLSSGLVYTGNAPLEISGIGNVIQSSENTTLLSVPNGANLTVTGLSFEGPGGFSAQNRGDVNGPAGKGIFVGVPTDATGDVALTLTDVRVRDVAGHGVHISDCSLAADCGSGSGSGGDGSAAGLVITLTDVVIEDVGHGRFDADGLRADERGTGSIAFKATGSTFVRVGADGVELDEGDAGDVTATIENTRFASNGKYCDPATFAPFMPVPDVAEFDDSMKAETDIPGAVTGSPDDRCIEREVDLYDSGFVEEYAFALDLDDGIDLDEAGDGSIITSMSNTVVTGNLDEGVDWDEEGPGDINVTFIATDANFNVDDGYKMSEADEGNVIGVVEAANAAANGGKGFVFEEEDGGDVQVTVTDTTTFDNDDGNETGLEVVQDDAGAGTLAVIGSNIADGIDAEGVAMQ